MSTNKTKRTRRREKNLLCEKIEKFNVNVMRLGEAKEFIEVCDIS
jgi:hypothetical protein